MLVEREVFDTIIGLHGHCLLDLLIGRLFLELFCLMTLNLFLCLNVFTFVSVDVSAYLFVWFMVRLLWFLLGLMRL